MHGTESNAAHARLCGLILDLDGTLADTLDDLTDAVNHAISPFGISPCARMAVRTMVGDGLAVLIQRAAPGVGTKARLRMIERFRTYYAEHFLDKTKLYPGWSDVLDALARRGVPVCVLSNKPDDFTQAMCAKLLSPWPPAGALGERAGVPLKPDPTAALTLCARMNLEPARVGVIGDSANDMELARRGGFPAIGAAWGFHDEQELRRAGAEVVVHAPADVLPMLDSFPNRNSR